tara:strand:+ start:57067 stop:57252 length:186 start_codon:yes stop_codon:yes gene_type:complete
MKFKSPAKEKIIKKPDGFCFQPEYFFGIVQRGLNTEFQPNRDAQYDNQGRENYRWNELTGV